MNYDKVLQGILDIGEEMMVCGAEVSRVEDSIRRMCESYEMTRVNVFIITSNIQVTVESVDERIITQIRQLIRYDVNFDRLDYLNDLSRYVCAKKPDYHVISDKLEGVLNRPKQPAWMKWAGSVMVASGFTVFFGGTWLDCIGSGVMGAVIMTMELILASRERNQIVYNFIVSVIAGFSALLLVKLGIGDSHGPIMMGGIMLLIPGIAMTNAMRDMLIGDIASGLLRLCNALLVATAIACGFALTIVVTGGAL